MQTSAQMLLVTTWWKRGRPLLKFKRRMNKIGKEISVMYVILNILLKFFSLIFLSGVCRCQFMQTATTRLFFNKIRSFRSRSISNEPNFILTLSVAR